MSVLTNVILAQYFLSEVISFKQKQGYMLVVLGVLGILIIAPKGSATDFGTNVTDVLKNCIRPTFISCFIIIYFILTGLIYHLYVNQAHRLSIYVMICSLFGTISVSTGKVIGILVRSESFSTNTSMSYSSQRNSSLLRESLPNMTDIPYNSLLEFVTYMKEPSHRQISIPRLDFWYSIAILIVMTLLSVISHEFFKQEAFSRFPISRFHPALYAGFNGWYKEFII